jgi:hypothetical protein
VKIEHNSGDFTAKECRELMKYIFIKGNVAKKYNDISATMGEKRPHYSTVKNLVARFRIGH